MRKRLGIYIHIPFCVSKCGYCDFYSVPGGKQRMPDYQSALLSHISESAGNISAYEVDSIYIGGGTPSCYGAQRIVEILDELKRIGNVRLDSEITMEVNPDTVRLDDLKLLRREGVDRLSIGVQSANNDILKMIGRRHNFKQAQMAVENARRAGFENVSLDLIYGLPEQTMTRWQANLDAALSLAPEHLSCYGLKVEPGTKLWTYKDCANLPDDDAQADMYFYAVETLEQFGYHQYEISNFAKSGKESRHNLKYWRMEEYAGFGPGAHSDFGGVRYGYVRDIDSYIAGRLVLSESETDSTLARDYEYVMLSLRTAAGIDRQTFEKRYRQRFQPMEALFEQYEKAGLASRTEGGWRLTPKGFLVSNSIIAALQEALAQQRAARQAAMAEGNFRIV